jgi:hypothetical protein
LVIGGLTIGDWQLVNVMIADWKSSMAFPELANRPSSSVNQ